MKALVGAFNQEKALVGAFSVIVKPVVEPMDRFTALPHHSPSSRSRPRATSVSSVYMDPLSWGLVIIPILAPAAPPQSDSQLLLTTTPLPDYILVHNHEAILTASKTSK